jgi:putative hydrolase of HD superfamily
MTNDLQKTLAFIQEVEKLKSVSRKIKPSGLNRFENSAEHSWQIALLSLALIPYSEKSLDTLKVVTMLLLHDIVEIDTGDKFAYASNHDDYENEHAAAKRIFGLLPDSQSNHFLKTWEEFEAAESEEAKFAKGIDRLMPVLQNLNNGGQSWVEHDVSISQILEKNKGVYYTNPQLWELVKQQVLTRGHELGLRN